MSPVFLYVPNVIGYVRLALLVAAFFVALDRPLVFFILYTLSYGVLDAVDGPVARKLGQRSRFGAALDMVLDRSSTNCLFALLAIRYPQAAPLLFLLIALDISSHVLHLLTTTGGSHKQTSRAEHGRLLHLYYGSSWFLFLLCGAHELAGLAVYAYSFFPEPLLAAFRASLLAPEAWWQPVLAVILLASLPLAVLKTFVSVVQLLRGARVLAEREGG